MGVYYVQGTEPNTNEELFPLKKKKKQSLKEYWNLPIISEESFYPPTDKRILQSNLLDVPGGDTYIGYLNDHFRMCDAEEIFQ